MRIEPPDRAETTAPDVPRTSRRTPLPGEVASRLEALGITLPEAPAPVAAYVPFVIVGEMLIISGQLPLWNGEKRHLGRLGDTMDVAEGREAAKLCALNILAQARAACDGNLDRIARCVRLGGFVASAPEFTDQPAVINGASELMLAAFGDAGRHARAAVGVASLPFGVSVEVEATFALK